MQTTGSPVPKSASRGGLVWAMSDEALIAAIAAGGRAAMRILYNRHQGRVFPLAARLLDDPASAQDVVSEAFIGVWRPAHRFQGGSSGLAWGTASSAVNGLAKLLATHRDFDHLTAAAG